MRASCCEVNPVALDPKKSWFEPLPEQEPFQPSMVRVEFESQFRAELLANRTTSEEDCRLIVPFVDRPSWPMEFWEEEMLSVPPKLISPLLRNKGGGLP